MSKTPVSLLERLRQPSDQDAWARFVALYAPLIHGWGRRAGLQPEDAADLAQDVLLSLVETMPGFVYDQHRTFRGWLRTVTLNRWRDRHKRRATQPLPAGAELAEAAAPDTMAAFWEEEYRQHLTRHALRVMQADFQPATWKAFWEVVVAGRRAPEVAAELGLTIGAVHAARFRVLARLRDELAGMLD
jgi:RNA polymerase sigma-70 factor (ECF subfamily)